ncbi:MAG: MBL fold metallo-hydrolase [Tannerella sp.]|jgi:glyoxylase-like metal-dependent hydrolase (beta-lactamase superfamily II)|nr:MBL fold metallo-hydrolase [Tannerella sp.]
MIHVKVFEFNPVAENTYLLYDETKEAVLIDCGCIDVNEKRILSDCIAQNNLSLKRLLCTHLHFDHVTGNGFIYKKYGIKPEADRKDVEVLPSIQEQVKSMGFPYAIDFIDIENFLTGNEIISFGDSQLTVLPVPGHSPGSLAFYSAKDNFVIVGDALFKGSIGRTDLWGGNFDVLIAAIKDKILTLPDETIIYPGHGSSTTVMNEKINNPFL